MARGKTNSLEWYRPNVGESWLIALALVGGALFFGLILGVLKTASRGAKGIWDIQSISYILTMVVPFVLIAFRARSERISAQVTGAQPVPLNRPAFGRLGAVGAFAVSAAALITLSVVIEPLTSIIPMPDVIKTMFEEAFVNTALWDAILATCILAPLLEELLCRGVMMRGMLSHTSPRAAIIWSAVIFAVIHMNPWQSIPALLMGLLFGWLYYRTGCLWLTIFLHCLNNSISTAVSRLFPDIGIDQGLIDILDRPTYLKIYVLSALVLAASLWLLHNYLPSRKKADE